MQQVNLMRDDFNSDTKDLLAKRVGYRCSNPRCRKLTSGPQSAPNKAVNVGVAAHITAASPNGPRYAQSITSNQRQDISNGIWLCQSCAKLIDNDPERYTVEKISGWKATAESMAIQEIEKGISISESQMQNRFFKIEKLMPELIAEMRDDLREYPIRREFVLLERDWGYWARGDELFYYFDDHKDLVSKMRILQNLSLITEITYNNVQRYVISEEFAEYLSD